MKLLLYCTKARPNIVKGLSNKFYVSNAWKSEGINHYKINGKVVAECDFEVEVINKYYVDNSKYCYRTPSLDEFQLMDKSCLINRELDDYIGWQLKPSAPVAYAIHIKNLKIFDRPKDIVHYGTNIHYDDEGWTETDMIWKAPSRMIEVYDDKWNRYVYIPMQSQEMCRILNGQQTIIVRKKVLKEMLNND